MKEIFDKFGLICKVAVARMQQGNFATCRGKGGSNVRLQRAPTSRLTNNR